MDEILKLELRQSEARQELADLLEKDPDNEKIGTLNVEMRSLDRQIMGHKIANPEPETRDFNGYAQRAASCRQLMDKSNVGEIFDAALGKRAVDGASAEIQKHYGLDVNQVPLAMLVKDWPDDDLEKRAVTPAPGNVGQEQNSIVPYVFPAKSAATFLGVVRCQQCRSVRPFTRC